MVIALGYIAEDRGFESRSRLLFYLTKRTDINTKDVAKDLIVSVKQEVVRERGSGESSRGNRQANTRMNMMDSVPDSQA